MMKGAKEAELEHGPEVPEQYREFSDLFSGKLPTGIPEHSIWDHEIPLQEGKQPKPLRIYPINPKHEQVLKEYIEENLAKGNIRPSNSPAGYPILFVPKKTGKDGKIKWRLCVDYRELNAITIKDCYPLPLISELRDKLGRAIIFTALDLPNGYNLIRIKEGEEWKTAFRCKFGHYEYLVMPFGLTNAPASFQNMMNHVLREFIDKFVVVYLDDILIYSENVEEHREHVRLVL